MTSKCCRDKSVSVAVYTERPRRLPLPKDRQGIHHHHHYHHHHHHHQNSNYHRFHHNVSENNGRRRGYNRKAQLLDYARHLRASAQPPDGKAAVPSSHLISHVKQVPSTQTAAVDNKTKRVNSPACFSNWDFSIPRFLRSTTLLGCTKGKGKKKGKNGVSTTSKMKNLVKKVQKNGSFLPKMLTALQKHH